MLLIVTLDAGECLDEVGGDQPRVVFPDGGGGLGDFRRGSRAGMVKGLRGLLEADFREVPDILTLEVDVRFLDREEWGWRLAWGIVEMSELNENQRFPLLPDADLEWEGAGAGTDWRGARSSALG